MRLRKRNGDDGCELMSYNVPNPGFVGHQYPSIPIQSMSDSWGDFWPFPWPK